MADSPTPPAAPKPAAPAPKPATPADIGASNVQATAPTGAPAVQTGTFTQKRKDLEAQLKQLDDNKSTQNQRARAMVRAQLNELRDMEVRSKGFHELTPIGNMLAVDASVLEANPDHHLRWVNETIPGRAALLRAKGYERVEDQTPGGDMVLWRIPREKWAEGVATKEAQTSAQLKKASGNRDDLVQELQTFFDKHNVKVDANDLVLREKA